MRTLLPVMVILALAGCGSQRVSSNPRLDGASAIVWLGIDYSAVRMVGLEGFNQPGQIFPGYLEKWNGLFLDEMLPELTDRLGKTVRVQVDAVMAQNERATARQVVKAASLPGPAVSPGDVAQMVRRYSLGGARGVGLVFVMDVMLKHEERACLYPTFFDLGTRAVIDSERVCYPAGGIGFRNYWFRPVKEAVRNL